MQLFSGFPVSAALLHTMRISGNAMIQYEPWSSTDLACVKQIQMQFTSQAAIRLALALYFTILALPDSTLRLRVKKKW